MKPAEFGVIFIGTVLLALMIALGNEPTRSLAVLSLGSAYVGHFAALTVPMGRTLMVTLTAAMIGSLGFGIAATFYFLFS